MNKDYDPYVLLYVEDNKFVRESTLLILDEFFSNIIIAVDGVDGLEKFKNNNIDLILTDISMPLMDGLEMSREIKKINIDIPIIILTAITCIDTIKESLNIGIDSFINKPIEDLDILLSKFNNIFKQINHDKRQIKIRNNHNDNERIKLLHDMIHNISHHFRQPLSIITAISSGYSFKIDHNIKLDSEDKKNMDTITKKAQELSNILNNIENINLNDITIEEIGNLIKISNPIYKNKE